MKSPAGTLTTTFSPFFFPSRARPTGLSFEIRPSAGLASAEPTIVNASLPSGLSTATVEPIWTWSVEWFSSMIVAFLISASSVWIRPFDEGLLVLGVLVLGVLGQIAVFLGVVDPVGDLGSLHRDHLVELRAELLETLPGEVCGLVVHGGGPRYWWVGIGQTMLGGHGIKERTPGISRSEPRT